MKKYILILMVSVWGKGFCEEKSSSITKTEALAEGLLSSTSEIGMKALEKALYNPDAVVAELAELRDDINELAKYLLRQVSQVKTTDNPEGT